LDLQGELVRVGLQRLLAAFALGEQPGEILLLLQQLLQAVLFLLQLLLELGRLGLLLLVKSSLL
jgi:hypothetical protein